MTSRGTVVEDNAAGCRHVETTVRAWNGDHVMASVTMSSLDSYFTKCMNSVGSGKEVLQDCLLPGSSDKGKGAVEEFVRWGMVAML